MMSTKIVEIPVPVDSYDTSILDFDGVLGGFDEPTDFPDVFVNQYKPKEPLTQSNVANIQNAAYSKSKTSYSTESEFAKNNFSFQLCK